MKPQALALLCLALAGQACRSSYDPSGPVGVRNMWAAKEIHQAALHQAILAQSTLYPYHFVNGAAALNELGWRDLQVLAEHFVTHGGALSVRHGNASEELYAERVQAVQDALAAAGVAPDRVRLSDGPPGGDGATSERVMHVLEAMEQPMQSEDVGFGSGSASVGMDGATAGGIQ